MGEGIESEEALNKLMGDSRSEYERKLKEKLARRQKRIDQGNKLDILTIKYSTDIFVWIKVGIDYTRGCHGVGNLGKVREF